MPSRVSLDSVTVEKTAFSLYCKYDFFHYPDAGRDWGQEEKGTTQDDMAVWHHRLNGHEFE